MARKEADEKRLQFAAHLFVYTTRDGMLISHLTHVLPSKLYEWATTEAWKDALQCWGYTGDCMIQGEEFHRQVALSLQKLSLQEAARLWKELFGISESKTRLNRFLGDVENLNGDIPLRDSKRPSLTEAPREGGAGEITQIH